MKYRIYVFVIISALLFSCNNNKQKAIIIGKVDNAGKEEVVYIEELGKRLSALTDSTAVNWRGRFRLSFDLKNAGFYKLYFNSGPFITLIISPGEKVIVSGDMTDFYNTKNIEGSEASLRVNVLHDSLRSTILLLDSLKALYASLDESDTLNKLRIEKQYHGVKQRHHHYSTAFILDDLKSLANISALYQEYAPDEFVFFTNRDLQFFKLVSDTLSQEFPKVRLLKTLTENYNSMLTGYNLSRIMQNTPMVSYDIPELKLPGPNGKIIALSLIRCKLLLLNFWNVNQQESIQNVLQLKEIYDKYHRYGFDIYQVSLESSFDKWKRVLAFEDLPWTNVCDTLFPYSSTKTVYNITSLPMNYLIDKQSEEIITRNIPPDMLDKHLNNYFSNRKK